ncbi:unnamed protein product, partial [marine sediment metagenome]
MYGTGQKNHPDPFYCLALFYNERPLEQEMWHVVHASLGPRQSMILAEKISKYYGVLPAVHDVSFSAEPGEVVGL